MIPTPPFVNIVFGCPLTSIGFYEDWNILFSVFLHCLTSAGAWSEAQLYAVCMISGEVGERQAHWRFKSWKSFLQPYITLYYFTPFYSWNLQNHDIRRSRRKASTKERGKHAKRKKERKGSSIFFLEVLQYITLYCFTPFYSWNSEKKGSPREMVLTLINIDF